MIFYITAYIEKRGIYWKREGEQLGQRLLYMVYFILLFYVVWFIRADVQDTFVINLVPFRTIRLFLVALLHGYASLPVILANLVGNIVLTIPIGMLLYRMFGKMRLFHVLISALSIPVIFELGQLYLHLINYGTRTVDMDDVILNGLGIILGYSATRWEAGKRAKEAKH